MALDERLKQNMIIEMWEDFQDKEKRAEYGKIFRHSGKKICLRWISENREDLILKIAETNLLTQNACKDILETLPDSMVSAKAKLLEISSNSTKRKYCL